MTPQASTLITQSCRKHTMLYFRALSIMVSVQHSLKLDEKRTILKLTGILDYFANVLGAIVNEAALVRVEA